MNRHVTNDKSQVQVIARAATILRALEAENAGLSLGQIAQRVNLARSTVQRIVSALEIEKLVIAATPNGRVRLGPTILRLAASVRSDFIALARPFLERLSEELHETVDLSTVGKDHLVFNDQVIGPQRLRTDAASRRMVGPSRTRPLGVAAITSFSISSAETMRCTVERARFTRCAICPRLRPAFSASSARRMVAARAITCTWLLSLVTWRFIDTTRYGRGRSRRLA